MVRTVLAIFVFIYANADDHYSLPVPGCVVVELDTHVECFTHSNGAVAKPEDAEKICASKGGRLAIIQHEKTWKILIEKLLKDKTTRSIWLGFTLLPNSLQLTPNVDLTNMSVYWSPSKITSFASQQYIFTHVSYKWDWLLSTTTAIDYLCQYNVTSKHCSITDVDDSKVIVSTCVNEKTVPHDAIIEIECSPGYHLKSSRFITCRNGIWDKPRCEAGCPPPTPKDHAILISDKPLYYIGDTIFYVCEHNYYNWRDFGKTHFTITCLNDSTWSDTDARCGSRQDFTTITINATEITEEKITLKCGLQSTDIKWIHNGRGIVNSSAFSISSRGYLLVNSNAEKIDGFYMCQTKDAENLQIGNHTYNIVGSRECKTQLGSSHISKGLFREGKSVILNCPQESDDHRIKWFTNEEEISSNEHQKIIVGGGLLLKKLTWRDNGTYKCQTMYNFKSNNCKYNVTFYLTVMPSAEAICGVKRKHRSNFYQPWFVILQYEGDVTPFCFGALLNDRWVVTSAFCLTSLLRKRQMKEVFAQLGSRETRKKYPILLVKIHPNYRHRLNVNDIGLIQLGGNPVEFNNDILPVCITSKDIGKIHKCEHRADLKGTLTGWRTNVNKMYGNDLVDSVQLNLASKNECRILGACGFAEDKFCAENKITDDKIPEFTFGDYGSPFVVSHNEKEYLLGIFTGGESNQYDYFTSIFHHYDWIKETID